MPLADHVGVVAGIPEQLRQRGDPVVEIALVADRAALVGRRPFVHVAETVAMGVYATQQRCPRRGAARICIEVCKAHALAGEGIQIGRPDFAAESAHVGIPHVIAEDDDDVRSAGAVSGRCNVREGVCRKHAYEAEDSRQPPPAARLSARCTRRTSPIRFH